MLGMRDAVRVLESINRLGNQYNYIYLRNCRQLAKRNDRQKDFLHRTDFTAIKLININLFEKLLWMKIFNLHIRHNLRKIYESMHFISIFFPMSCFKKLLPANKKIYLYFSTFFAYNKLENLNLSGKKKEKEKNTNLC